MRNWGNNIREGVMEERGFQRDLGERERMGDLNVLTSVPSSFRKSPRNVRCLEFLNARSKFDGASERLV